MNGLLKNSGIILLLLAGVVLVLNAFAGRPDNLLLFVGGILIVLGLGSYIIFNRIYD